MKSKRKAREVDQSRPMVFWFTTKTLSGHPWEGFRPVQYWLDSEEVEKLNVERGTSGEKITLSVLDAFVQIRDADANIDELENGLRELSVKTSAGQQAFSGPSFNLELLEALLRLHRAGINAFNAWWFWYDFDEVMDSPQHRYSFFVVFEDEIVDSNVLFSDWSGNGFYPAVFSSTLGERIWRDKEYWDEALAKFWYEKFYSETKMGRLMTLRPDGPELFHYPKPPAYTDTLPRVRWWLFGVTLVSGSACIYFWSGSIGAALAGLIFILLMGMEMSPGSQVADLLYQAKVSTNALQRALLETRSRSFDGHDTPR